MALDQTAASAPRASIPARLAMAAQAVVALVAAAQLISYLAQAALADRIASGIAESPFVYEANDERVRALMLTQVGVRLLASLLFLIWLHRAVTSARRLSDDVTLPTPGEAVAAFFIPFINLVRPVLVISRLHAAVDPEKLPAVVRVIDDPAAGYRAPARRIEVLEWRRITAPVGVWWALYLLPILEGFFIGRVGAPASTLASDSRVAALFAVARVLGAVLGALVVVAIERRLGELGRRREAQGASQGR